MTFRDLNLWVLMVVMLGLGVYFLFFARHIQRSAQKSATRGIARHMGLHAYVSSTSYLIMTRVMGLVCLATSAFLVWVAFKAD